MGVFEHPSFAHGTRAVAQMLAQLTDKGAVTVVRMSAQVRPFSWTRTPPPETERHSW
jgi:3-phosphoglycerate kinase